MTYLYHESVNFPFTLAPMVGLSHVALRALIHDYMPEKATTWWPTEMLNSRRLPTQEVGETAQTIKDKRDTVLVPQILGNEEHYIAMSIKKLEELGIQGIDINMGCPVHKALKHNYGVALMGDADYAAEVVAMTIRHTSLPVSVKLRAVEESDKKMFFDFVSGLEKAGASYLCLHPRTAKQKRRGNADWSQIKELKDHLSIPIIGNGDIQTWEDAFAMKEETNCDAVMIGRALTARPWMMWQIGDKLGWGKPELYKDQECPYTPEQEAYEYGRACKKFISYCYDYFDPVEARKRILFYMRVSHVWLNFGLRLEAKIRKSKQQEEMNDVIDEFFSKPGLAFCARTDLRY